MGCNAALHLPLPETRPEEVEMDWELGAAGVPPAAPGASGGLAGGQARTEAPAGGGWGGRGHRRRRWGSGRGEERLEAPGSRAGWSATLLAVPRPP